MDLSISKVKMTRKRVESLRTRRMQNGCDEVVGGSATERELSVLLVDETSDEESDDDEYATKWV